MTQQHMAMQFKTSNARETTSGAPRPRERPSKPKEKRVEGAVDPDELTRRLSAVLAEQQALADRKRRARLEWEANKAFGNFDQHPSTRRRDGARPDGRKGSQAPANTSADLITELRRSKSSRRKSSHMDTTVAELDATSPLDGYHHVPQEAARSFTRTTTADSMRSDDLVHKLSKTVLKFHKDAPRPPMASPTQQQHPQSPRKHTFEAEISRILPENPHYPHPYTKRASWHERRSSTGNTADGSERTTTTATDDSHARRSLICMDPSMLLPDVAEDITPPPEEEEDPPPHERRVDWTQSDESRHHHEHQGHHHRHKIFHLKPLLRKADSLWALRNGGRAGSRGSGSGSGGSDYEKEKGSPLVREKDIGVAHAKPVKTGFFARFKR